MPRCDWSPAAPPRADWRTPRRSRTLCLYLQLSCLLLAASPALASSSSSPPAPPAPPDAELLRDAPLYPPLRDYDNPLYDTLKDTPTDFSRPKEIQDLDSNEEDDYNFGTVVDEPDDDEVQNEAKSRYFEENDSKSYETNAIHAKPKSILEKQNINDISRGIEKPYEGDIPIEPPMIQKVPNELDVTDYEVSDDDVPDDVTENGDVEDLDDSDRKKRSANQEMNKTKASSGRVQTGDTILNIRGAVRDSIGDAPPRAASAPPRPASRLDAVVIRPAAAAAEERVSHHTHDEDEQSPGSPNAVVVEAGARATLPCDLTGVTDVKWYRDNELVSLPLGGPTSPPSGSSGGGGGGSAWRTRTGDGREAVVVPRAGRGDAARWRCAGESRAGSVAGTPMDLMIYEPVRAVYLAVDGRRLDAGNTWVPARDRTTIDVRCVAEGGVPQPSLSWRLAPAGASGAAGEATLDAGLYLRLNRTNHSLQGVSWSGARVLAARELHNATLQCVARQARAGGGAGAAPVGEGEVAETTAQMLVHVTYPPSFVISRWPGFGVALVAGAAAALRCDVDANPPARAWWQRDGAHTTSPPPLEGGGGSGGGAATLRWAALPAAAAGWYRCRASWLHTDYSSIGYYLNVQAAESSSAPPAPGAEPERQELEVPLGGSAQLHCPKGSVGCWWRREDNSSRNSGGGTAGGGTSSIGGTGSIGASWTPAGSRHAHGVLGIKDAIYEEGGEYRCLGAAAPDLARLRELKRVTLRVTGGATARAVSTRSVGGGWRLECAVCGAGVRAAWLRGAGGGAGGGAGAAELRPDTAPHCWRAVLHVTEPDEVWCVASSPGGGAVAVFPARASRPAPHTPAPRHLVRGAATVVRTSSVLLLIALLLQ